METKTHTLSPLENSGEEKAASPAPKRKSSPRARMALKAADPKGIQLSPEDRDLLENNWRTDGYGYIFRLKRTGPQRRRLYMHQEVIRRVCGYAPVQKSGYVIDHINYNKMDNRRENLRVVSVAVNNANRPGLRRGFKMNGKFAVFHYGKWQARVKHKNKTVYLGSYETFEEARAVSLGYMATLDRPNP